MAGECRRIKGETYVSNYPGVKSFCIRRPLGVTVAIAPFNFPLLLGSQNRLLPRGRKTRMSSNHLEMTPVIGPEDC